MKLNRRDFNLKLEDFSTKRKSKREYLNDSLTHHLVKVLNRYLQNRIRMPRVRMGKQQEIEILMNEETLLLAQYLRNERQNWTPRLSIPN